MTEKNEMLLQVPLKGAIYNCFDMAFQNSGLSSRTEYIRHLIKQDYNRMAVHYSAHGSGPSQYELQDEDIKDEVS